MANAFGGFTVTSPLTTQTDNAPLTLASNSIRDYFGPTVQTVFDCLVSRGNTPPPTLLQILQSIRRTCQRDINAERMRLVDRLEPLSEGRKRVAVNLAKKGGEEWGYITSAKAVKAALIVLLQHNIVRAIPPPNKKASATGDEPEPDDSNEKGSSSSPRKKQHDKCCYVVQIQNATYLHRYSRYVEYAKKVYRLEGSVIIEELLVKGRMGTEELVEASWNSLKRIVLNQKEETNATNKSKKDQGVHKEEEEEEEAKEEEEEMMLTEAEALVLKDTIETTLKQLVQGGFVELVPPIDATNSSSKCEQEDEGEQEAEFSTIGAKRTHGEMEGENGGGGDTMYHKDKALKQEHDDTPTNSLDNKLSKSRLFPLGAVWRVNISMFHASLRAFYLGRLVQERYGDRISYCGSIVTAALKLAAHKEFAPTHHAHKGSMSEDVRQSLIEERGVFTPESILPYLTPTVVANLKSKAGGALANLSAILVKMSHFTYPQVIMEVEEAQGHTEGGKFEVATRSLSMHLRNRILHQVVKSHYGDVAARICFLLDSRGYLESDLVAEHAMVPAKDAQELLHKLYKARYIEMFYLQNSKAHNPKTAIFLWHVDRKRLTHTILQNLCRALVNLRVRRQHEVQLGKDFIERAKDTGDMEENETEQDKENYQKFCQGLERIDNACLQVDETLMVLKDFKL